METQELNQDYWNKRYADNATGWDLGKVSPPLKNYIDQLSNKAAAILIPGGGNGHEAMYLAENGFTNITVLDISAIALNVLRTVFEQRKLNSIQLICADFFEFTGSYDLIIEQTFFCALDPTLRAAYTKKMAELLRPDAKLMGLLFDTHFKQSPPFGGNLSDYQKLFSQDFVILKMEPCYNSVAPRAGTELFFICKLKSR